MRPVVKPLASKHHAELQRITDRACEKLADLAAIETACAGVVSRDELAFVAFAWAKHAMAQGNWGWWSVSPDGRLNPALVAWNKSWFVVPIDLVIAVYEAKGSLSQCLGKLHALPMDGAGELRCFIG